MDQFRKALKRNDNGVPRIEAAESARNITITSLSFVDRDQQIPLALAQKLVQSPA